MKIFNVKWGIYSTTGMVAMISSMPTPCVFSKEKRFVDETKANDFVVELKKAAAILGYVGSDFRVSIEPEQVEE